jgi:hypothetical protein
MVTGFTVTEFDGSRQCFYKRAVQGLQFLPLFVQLAFLYIDFFTQLIPDMEQLNHAFNTPLYDM